MTIKSFLNLVFWWLAPEWQYGIMHFGKIDGLMFHQCIIVYHYINNWYIAIQILALSHEPSKMQEVVWEQLLEAVSRI